MNQTIRVMVPFEPGDGILYRIGTQTGDRRKEKSNKELELDIRDAEVSVSQAQRNWMRATVKATINGVVKTVGDPKVGQVDGEAFSDGDKQQRNVCEGQHQRDGSQETSLSVPQLPEQHMGERYTDHSRDHRDFQISV